MANQHYLTQIDFVARTGKSSRNCSFNIRDVPSIWAGKWEGLTLKPDVITRHLMYHHWLVLPQIVQVSSHL